MQHRGRIDHDEAARKMRQSGESIRSVDDEDIDTIVAEDKAKASKEEEAAGGAKAAASAQSGRRKPMLVGKYNQWMLVDKNRVLGEEVRKEARHGGREEKSRV